MDPIKGKRTIRRLKVIVRVWPRLIVIVEVWPRLTDIVGVWPRLTVTIRVWLRLIVIIGIDSHSWGVTIKIFTIMAITIRNLYHHSHNHQDLYPHNHDHQESSSSWSWYIHQGLVNTVTPLGTRGWPQVTQGAWLGPTIDFWWNYEAALDQASKLNLTLGREETSRDRARKFS